MEACSATVSDAWPSAMPAWFFIVSIPEASVSTPNACAVWTTFTPSGPATVCHRSAYAVLIDTALAVCGVYGPFSPGEALCTRDQPGAPAGIALAEYFVGSASSGM